MVFKEGRRRDVQKKVLDAHLVTSLLHLEKNFLVVFSGSIPNLTILTSLVDYSLVVKRVHFTARTLEIACQYIFIPDIFR